jgi:hypothetical protein
MSKLAEIPVRTVLSRETFESEVLAASRPVVLRDLVAGWPLVGAAKESSEALARGIVALDAGLTPHVIEAPAAADGRIFYGEDYASFNFTRKPARIAATLERLLALRDTPGAPALFLESASTSAYLPEFSRNHPMPLLDARTEARIWIGNAVKVNTHFDLAHNIACVVGGRRRFTLFPPEQIANLYLAPLDFTPSGAPVSMVQFTAPDHARFPKFTEALRHAQQAELGPGDALFIPYGWWHHVESLEPLNVLVNYWWSDAAAAGVPHGALLHAVLTIRDLPEGPRAVWESIFRQLVFTDPEQALGHLPPAQRGLLAPPSAEMTRRIRDLLAQDLNRDKPKAK